MNVLGIAARDAHSGELLGYACLGNEPPSGRMLRLSGRLASFGRYRHPRFRAARYARVVRLEGRAVVRVARSHVIRRVVRPVVRESKPEPEATSPNRKSASYRCWVEIKPYERATDATR